MSLEAAILDNTLVLRELIQVITKMKMSEKSDLFVELKPTAQPEVENSNYGIPICEIERPQQLIRTAEMRQILNAYDTVKEITLADISAAIIQGVKKDRARVVSALAAFGAKKGTDLQEVQYKSFLESLNGSR